MKTRNKEFIDKLKTIQFGFGAKQAKPEMAEPLAVLEHEGRKIAVPKSVSCDKCGGKWEIKSAEKIDTPMGPAIAGVAAMVTPPFQKN